MEVIIYFPVVEKDIYYNKSNKNKELAGKFKERIAQISHSKKWPQYVKVERDGKIETINSYSVLQDQFYGHMKGRALIKSQLSIWCRGITNGEERHPHRQG